MLGLVFSRREPAPSTILKLAQEKPGLLFFFGDFALLLLKSLLPFMSVVVHLSIVWAAWKKIELVVHEGGAPPPDTPE